MVTTDPIHRYRYAADLNGASALGLLDGEAVTACAVPSDLVASMLLRRMPPFPQVL
jgi:hypothetical protein